MPDDGKTARDQVFGLIRASGAQMVDVKFCGALGRWHHFTMPSDQFTEKSFHDGIPFNADGNLGPAKGRPLLLFPDPETPFLDPFNQVPTLSIVADVFDAATRKPHPLDPRATARRALAYVSESGMADTILMSIDLEFYIFDYVRYRNQSGASGYIVDSAEAEWNTYRPPVDGYQPAHANPRGSGNHALPPRDSLNGVRNEISVRLKEAGLGVRYHHHDVGGPGQCEMALVPGSLLQAADGVQKAKYFTRMVAVTQNRIASFMPKPFFKEAGSGMHVHQHLVRNGESLFHDSEPKQVELAALSPTAHQYMHGIRRHISPLTALTNPGTNSYKRLAEIRDEPGRGASAAFNVHETSNPAKGMHVEYLLADATCNPYLALAAMTMAGLDGVKNAAQPDPCEESAPAPGGSVPIRLESALDDLECSSAFLLEGGVFTEQILSDWIRRKRREARDVGLRPHPYEFHLYLDP